MSTDTYKNPDAPLTQEEVTKMAELLAWFRTEYEKQQRELAAAQAEVALIKKQHDFQFDECKKAQAANAELAKWHNDRQAELAALREENVLLRGALECVGSIPKLSDAQLSELIQNTKVAIDAARKEAAR